MEKLKLYTVIRNYRSGKILDICWAKDIEDVYKVMCWEKEDKPKLEIQELPLGVKPRCILSHAIKA